MGAMKHTHKGMMSTIEALQLQLDNLRHQLQEVQVENEKLKAGVSTDHTVEVDSKVEQLQGEVDELRWSLHEAQELEVGSSDLLNKSREEYNALKCQYDEVASENEQLTSEIAEYRARYERTYKELECVKGTAEVELVSHSQILCRRALIDYRL